MELVSDMPAGSQKQSQVFHGILDTIRHAQERWPQRFALENPCFAERCKKWDLQILLEISAGINAGEYVIV
jgi:hypothetical protein